MSDNSSNSWLISNEYQPSAFYFKVVFSASLGITDTSFKEVSGISKEMLTEDVKEGGENGVIHKLPTGFSHPRLVMKRGIAPISSPLVVWCTSIFNGELDVPVCSMPIMVYLMNEEQTPVRGWAFTNAYPVKWDVDSFESLKNEVAIETIEFEYESSYRVI
ncbi:MAG: phage tail protein [Paludibacteraceae bacterium]|nr:phage tail protein [Paludibacteraceae bacterium]